MSHGCKRLLYQPGWSVGTRPDSDCRGNPARRLLGHAGCRVCESFRSYLDSPAYKTSSIECERRGHGLILAPLEEVRVAFDFD